MKVQDHLFQTCLGLVTQTHITNWREKKNCILKKKAAYLSCIQSFSIKQILPWGMTGGSSVRFLSRRCPVTLGTDQTTEIRVWSQPISTSNRSFRRTISTYLRYHSGCLWLRNVQTHRQPVLKGFSTLNGRMKFVGHALDKCDTSSSWVQY